MTNLHGYTNTENTDQLAADLVVYPSGYKATLTAPPQIQISVRRLIISFKMPPQPQQRPPALLAVLGTAELLEKILLYLPRRDLLLATRVQKQFRSVMKGSSKIKQALWFEPQYEVSDADIATMNAYVPEEKEEFRPNNSTIKHDVHFLPEGLPNELLMNPFFNGWIREDNCKHRFRGDYPLFEHHYLSISNPGVLAILDDAPSNASWRSMLLLQPHAAPATLTVNMNDLSSGFCMDAQKVSLRQGLNMSVFADLSLENAGVPVELNLHPGLKVSPKNGVDHMRYSKARGLTKFEHEY
jgi:hypothetical protein